MTWIFDQPAWIVIVGMVLAAIFGMLWANTGKNYWLVALGGVVVLAIVLMIVERSVETDPEKLRRIVQEIAADVEKNDKTLLYKYIHSQATALQQKANSELPSYEFADCTVTKIYEVKVDDDKSPPEGKVEFMVRVEGNFQLGADAIGGQHFRYVTLFFKQEPDGTWKMVDYEHEAPTGALMGEQK